MGGKSKSKTTQSQQFSNTSSTTLNDNFKQLQDSILGQAQQANAGFDVNKYNTTNNSYLGMVNDTIGGKYLDPANNPTLKGYVDAAINPLRDSLAATSLKIGDASQLAGAYGGSRQQVLSDQALKDFNTQATDAASKIYYTDYNTERQNQINAGAMLGQVADNASAALNPAKNLAAIASLFAPYNSTTNSSGNSSGESTTVQQQSMLQNIAMLMTAFGAMNAGGGGGGAAAAAA